MPSVCLLSPATRQTAGLRRSPQWLLRPLPGSGWKESSTASSTRRPVASPPWWALFLLGSRQEPSSSLPGVCLSPSYSAYRTGGGCPRGHGVYETSGAHQGSERALSFKVGWGRARNASILQGPWLPTNALRLAGSNWGLDPRVIHSCKCQNLLGLYTRYSMLVKNKSWWKQWDDRKKCILKTSITFLVIIPNSQNPES